MAEKKSKVKTSTKMLIFCNHCKSETNHICVSEHKGEMYYEDFWEENWYRIWICAGCQSATFEVSGTMNGMVDKEENQVYESVLYPKREVDNLKPKKYIKLPEKLVVIYKEAINAYNNNMFILCTAGLRALIEGICVDKGINRGGLQQKIKGLAGILPQNIVDNLQKFRFIGNKALHELEPPEKYNLRLAIEICDDLLNFLYELDYKTERFANHDGFYEIPV